MVVMLNRIKRQNGFPYKTGVEIGFACQIARLQNTGVFVWFTLHIQDLDEITVILKTERICQNSSIIQNMLKLLMPSDISLCKYGIRNHSPIRPMR